MNERADRPIEYRRRAPVSRVVSSPEGLAAIRGQYTTRPILYRFSLLYERNAKGANTTASASR